MEDSTKFCYLGRNHSGVVGTQGAVPASQQMKFAAQRLLAGVQISAPLFNAA